MYVWYICQMLLDRYQADMYLWDEADLYGISWQYVCSTLHILCSYEIDPAELDRSSSLLNFIRFSAQKGSYFRS